MECVRASAIKGIIATQTKPLCLLTTVSARKEENHSSTSDELLYDQTTLSLLLYANRSTAVFCGIEGHQIRHPDPDNRYNPTRSGVETSRNRVGFESDPVDFVRDRLTVNLAPGLKAYTPVVQTLFTSYNARAVITGAYAGLSSFSIRAETHWSLRLCIIVVRRTRVICIHGHPPSGKNIDHV